MLSLTKSRAYKTKTYDLLQIFVSLIVIKREQFQVRVKYNNNIISSFAFT